MAYTDTDEDELDQDEQPRERKGTQAEDEANPPGVRLPSRAAVASPLDSAAPMPQVASPMAGEGAVQSPWERAEAQGSTAGPQVASPLAHPDPYAEYNKRMASPHGISTIHNPVLRTLAHIGDIAGTAVAPGITGMIPGTTLNERGQEHRAFNQGKALEDENEQALKDTQTQATTEETQARTGDIAAQQKLREKQANVPQKTQLENPQQGYSAAISDALANGRDPATDPHVLAWKNAVTEIQKTPPPSTAADTQKFEGVGAKVAGAGLSTDPVNYPKSLKTALDRGAITQDEYNAASGYQTAHPTPATNITVKNAEGAAAEARKQAGKTYMYNGKLVKGSEVPATADATEIKDPEGFRKDAQNISLIQKNTNHLVKDINDRPEIFDDPASRSVITTALDDNKAKSVGLLVAGTGGSLTMPSGAGHVIDQLLQNNAVPKENERAVKNFIVDYLSMREKLIPLQMALQKGKIGRGSQVLFQAMMATLPGLATADSTMARRQMSRLQETIDSVSSDYGELVSEKPEQIKGDTGDQQGGGTQGETPVYRGDKLIGYTKDGKTFSRIP